METIKVSVIIPIYKVEKYLQKCLDSIVNQTYQNLEIILVDDGSPDTCPQICDEYAEKDDRIKVIHKQNEGASIARNFGLDVATGEYVYFLDADDWIDADAIETLVNASGGNLDCVGFNFIKEYDDLSQIQDSTLWQEAIYEGENYFSILRRSVGLVEDELKYLQQMNAFAVIWSKLYKKEIIDKNNIRFVDIKKLGSFEDGLFNIEFFSYATSFRYIDKAMYHYRKNNALSVAGGYKFDFYEKQKTQLAGIRDLVKIEDEKILKAYHNRIAFMAMEYCLNAIKGKGAFKEKRQEIKQIFQDKEYVSALKSFSIKQIPFVWKVYYSVLKTRSTIGTYFMTKLLLFMAGRK